MTMRVESTSLPGVLLIEPRVFGDERGFVFETFRATRYGAAGISLPFVQDNVCMSRRGVVRGLHLQHPHDQGKLVWVLQGEVYDVAVDVRVGSPTFANWVAVMLSDKNHLQLYIPPGFAHGFCATSESALFAYKCTDEYHPEDELGVAFDDPELAIPWPVESPQVNARDRANLPLAQIDKSRLPRYLP
jgi:dTDP-4-dehydrorhamnose 3,5-epimerase